MKKSLIIFGAGGHCKVVLDTALSARMKIEVIVDDHPQVESLCGIRVEPSHSFRWPSKFNFIVAIGDNYYRRKHFDRLISLGGEPVNVIHPNTHISPYAELGRGIVICYGCLIHPLAKIGDNVILNTTCSVEHDCEVGKDVIFGPGVHLAGGVTIEEGAFLGIGSVVIPQVVVGQDSVLGGGSVITKNIPPRVLAFGNPAKVQRCLDESKTRNRQSFCFYTSSDVSVLTTQDGERWDEILNHIPRSDFYHTYWYHRLAEKNGEGEARLFVYQEGNYTIAFPFLLRSLKNVEGLQGEGESWWDATSVYGYGGPICSHESCSKRIVLNFQSALKKYLQENHIVAIFSRLHPLLNSHTLLEELGECRALGKTISMDLTLSPEEQWAKFRNGHKGGIKKLQKLNIECFCDEELLYIEDFKTIYRETMKRVGAKDYYFFSDEYFDFLFHQSQGMIKLLIARFQEKIAAVGLFCLCGRVMQYHLSASVSDYWDLAPGKALLDFARLWGMKNGAHVLHLGGGVGSAEDSLFQFKAGFSDRRHDFYIWKWVVQPKVYEQLVAAKEVYLKNQGKEIVANDFFPIYRGV